MMVLRFIERWIWWRESLKFLDAANRINQFASLQTNFDPLRDTREKTVTAKEIIANHPSTKGQAALVVWMMPFALRWWNNLPTQYLRPSMKPSHPSKRQSRHCPSTSIDKA